MMYSTKSLQSFGNSTHAPWEDGNFWEVPDFFIPTAFRDIVRMQHFWRWVPESR
jgi:hypothetical protein